jgi:hypothetical protein
MTEIKNDTEIKNIDENQINKALKYIDSMKKAHIVYYNKNKAKVNAQKLQHYHDIKNNPEKQNKLIEYRKISYLRLKENRSEEDKEKLKMKTKENYLKKKNKLLALEFVNL